jgi:hypothetical protein
MIEAKDIIYICEAVANTSGFHVTPVKLSKNIIYIKINNVLYGYKSKGVESAKEIFRKFSKMINVYGAGGNSLVWLKKVATRVCGGESGKKIGNI